METKQKREAEIRKMVQQLNEKARMLIESTQSSSHLGMPLEQRVKRLEDLKFSAVGLLNETIQVLTEESYEKNRHDVLLLQDDMPMLFGSSHRQVL